MSDLEAARNIALNLFELDTPVEEADVRSKAALAVQVVSAARPGADIDLDALVRELEANLNVFVGNPATLVDQAADHIPWLADKRGSIEWNFSRRYRRLLSEKKGWALQTLQRGNGLTDQILELLEDPIRPGHWDRRGMVVGEVQSGKTSSYIELACKAADAGYKFIVILTGATNGLRAQTQLRFDEGFLGWDTRLNLALVMSNERVGVGTLTGENLYSVITATTASERGDFSLGVANQFNVRLGGDPVLMVVKKNGSVLRNLIRWAQSMGLTDDDRIPNIPMLVIDDEADYASVNTRAVDPEGEEDPTTINQRIRALLNTFQRSAFIGYTATPFANIFIYPEGESDEHGLDLFPRDFLINLPAPSNHVGPTRVFGMRRDPVADMQEVEPLPLVRLVDDHENHIPSQHRSSLIVDELPESLKSAIKAFILSCAARAARGDSEQHNSMLVHVTRFVDVQSQVADLVRFELQDLQNRIRYGDGNSSTPIMDELRMIWYDDFVPTSGRVRDLDPDLSVGCHELSWDEVSSELVTSSQRIQVKVINGSARDALDYWDHPRGLSAIAIGGDKLSRGLTLEGLSISYYLRASRMYDTLLQMGRWFGYRPRYIDLCRLYTTEDLREAYAHITVATEELKQDFDLMAERGMTPREFGLKVRTHPAGLVITGAGKMRNGTRMTVSYSGTISETISFERQEEARQINLEAFGEFIKELGEVSKTKSGNLLWKKVHGSRVADLLEGVNISPGSRSARGDLIAKYIRNQMPRQGLVNWTVALISNQSGADGTVTIGGREVYPVSRSQYPRDASDRDAVYRVRRLVNPADEYLDLIDGQYAEALQLTIQNYWDQPRGTRYQSEPTSPSGYQIRRVRSSGNGLLLIYPVWDLTGGITTPFVGFAASFPTADTDTPIDYIVNTTYLREELFD